MLKAIDQTVCYIKDLSEQSPGKYVLSLGVRHYGVIYLWVDEVYVLTNGLLKAVLYNTEDGTETTVVTFPAVDTWFLIDPAHAELVTNEQLYEAQRTNAVDGSRMIREMERLGKQLKKEQDDLPWDKDTE